MHPTLSRLISSEMGLTLHCEQLLVQVTDYFIRTQYATNAEAAAHLLPMTIGCAMGGLLSGQIINRSVYTSTQHPTPNTISILNNDIKKKKKKQIPPLQTPLPLLHPPKNKQLPPRLPNLAHRHHHLNHQQRLPLLPRQFPRRPLPRPRHLQPVRGDVSTRVQVTGSFRCEHVLSVSAVGDDGGCVFGCCGEGGCAGGDVVEEVGGGV